MWECIICAAAGYILGSASVLMGLWSGARLASNLLGQSGPLLRGDKKPASDLPSETGEALNQNEREALEGVAEY